MQLISLIKPSVMNNSIRLFVMNKSYRCLKDLLLIAIVENVVILVIIQVNHHISFLISSKHMNIDSTYDIWLLNRLIVYRSYKKYMFICFYWWWIFFKFYICSIWEFKSIPTSFKSSLRWRIQKLSKKNKELIVS